MTATRVWLFISLLHPLARGIVEGPQRHTRGDTLVRHLHFVAARRNPFRVYPRTAAGEIAETERSASSVPIDRRGDPPDELAIPPDRLIVVEHAVGALER